MLYASNKGILYTTGEMVWCVLKALVRPPARSPAAPVGDSSRALLIQDKLRMSLNTLSWNLRLSNLQPRSMILARRISIPHKARSFILLLRCVVEPLRDDTTEKSKGRAKGYIANPSKHVIPEVDLPRSTEDLATTVLWEKYSITHCTKMIKKALTWEAKAFIPWLNQYLDRVTDIRYVAGKPESTYFSCRYCRLLQMCIQRHSSGLTA
ncbi:unnamed protein product [Penicillium nalgiovense]|uniref:Uncharacterized protein n=1 Tax=Penicillium salamii TaxID=1612424 RepID=A0A9W4JJ47_9EURO|nr:unnamed protein product [Penicillium salamii]CAG8899983.1 unnamed protein product [Penicillium nalgiovense]CAG8158804.1 unnamed protein product [Penicillium salamii]CAG8221614.1 unnamed protein product [Penicillium salamii]CAG8401474.1 unnamed protein product [Penicillium salamii]